MDAMMSLPLPAMPPGLPAGETTGPVPGTTPGMLPGTTTPGLAPSAFAQLLEAESARVDLAALPDTLDAPIPLAADGALPLLPAPEGDVAPSAIDVSPPLPAPDPALLAQLVMSAAPAAEPVAGDGVPVEASMPGMPARRPARPLPPAAEAAATTTPTAPGPDKTFALPPTAEQALLPWATPSARSGEATRRTAPREELPVPGAISALGAARPHEGVAAASPSSAPADDAATIAAPVDSSDFAPELAARVSVLARDGVQRAELRLNPVELGPMAVQIAIEGAMARVDFGAEIAATRSAIESSLPALAAALRDAGLTLAGGGVSQHLAGQGDRQGGGQFSGDTTGRGETARADRTGEPVPARPASRLVRAGGVDLYA